jgi:hypothetical protein
MHLTICIIICIYVSQILSRKGILGDLNDLTNKHGAKPAKVLGDMMGIVCGINNRIDMV